MIRLFARIFIKDHQNTEKPSVRRAYGVLAGAVGIVLNLFLFLFKFIAGTVSGAISITADAFNNLSDAGSSIVTLLGFRLAGQKPDPEHPYGHGRLEYISGLIVSMLIILMGFELLRTSFERILHPAETSFSPLIFLILALSILVKFYMFWYNQSLSKKLDAVALHSTAIDSLTDMIATSLVLVSGLIAYKTGVNIDGWCGLAVAVFIIYSGITAAIETINPLLGQPPSKEFIKTICKVVTSYPGILGVHDIMVHDYGPGRRFVSLHAEVPSDVDILKAHDTIDNIEMRLSHEFGVTAVIHMDPISMNDPETSALRAQVGKLVLALGDGFSFHDFRIVKGKSHTNVLFDVLTPYETKLTDEEIVAQLKEEVHKINPHYRCIINVDKKFI